MWGAAGERKGELEQRANNGCKHHRQPLVALSLHGEKAEEVTGCGTEGFAHNSPRGQLPNP